MPRKYFMLRLTDFRQGRYSLNTVQLQQNPLVTQRHTVSLSDYLFSTQQGETGNKDSN